MLPIDSSLKNRIVILSHVNLLHGIILSVLALGLVAVPATARAQVTSGEQNPHSADTPSRADAASLQKKANEAQARIRANQDDRDELMRAVKTNEVPLAKQVLLRNGFTPEEDLFGQGYLVSLDRSHQLVAVVLIGANPGLGFIGFFLQRCGVSS